MTTRDVRSALTFYFQLLPPDALARLATKVVEEKPLVGPDSEMGLRYEGRRDPLLIAADGDMDKAHELFDLTKGRPQVGMGYNWWLAQARIIDVREAVKRASANETDSDGGGPS